MVDTPSLAIFVGAANIARNIHEVCVGAHRIRDAEIPEYQRLLRDVAAIR
jgi:hypothetical protein